MAGTEKIAVGGLTPFSTVDYPGRLAAVVFCQGCPWRCAYCHNSHLRPTTTASAGTPWREVAQWLESRRGLLDAVVFSGGEPLLQRGLPDAMRQVRMLGFSVGLHTTGIHLGRFIKVLPLADWVGFDVKAPFDRYARVTGTQGGAMSRRSLLHLLACERPCEVRCTVDESLLSPNDAQRMTRQLAGLGLRHLVLQAVRHGDGTTRTISEAFIDAVAAEIGEVELR
jgi:pyruvate formate lyase activating enzyme